MKEPFQFSAEITFCDHPFYRNIINFLFIQRKSCTKYPAILCNQRNTRCLSCFRFRKQRFTACQVCTCEKLLFQRIFLYCRRVKTVKQILKFQLSAEKESFFCIKISQFCLFIRKLYGTVRTNRSQSLAHLRHIIMFSHWFPGSVWLQLFQMFMSILNTSILHNNLCGSLLTYSRDSRNIVSTVTHQSL